MDESLRSDTVAFAHYLPGICLNWNVSEGELGQALSAVEYRLQCNVDTLAEIEAETSSPSCDLRRLYRRVEYLLISLRASADVLLHLVVLVQNLPLAPDAVSIGRLLATRELGADIRQILRHYTRRDDFWWRFITETRNEVAHQTTIRETYPILIEEDHTQDPPLLQFRFAMPSGERPDLVPHYRHCVRHIQDLAEAVIRSLAQGMR